LPEWKAKFDTPFGEDEFNHRKNIESYLRKTLARFGEPVTSISFEMRGTKRTRYTLTAWVRYKAERETHPRLISVPIRWKAVYDEKKWRERSRREFEGKVGREEAKRLMPAFYEGEDKEE
jgi:hypothetical protein